VALIEADQGWVHIRLEGGCQGCSLAEVTIRQGIEPLLRTRVPELVGLADVTDHAAGPRRSSPPRSDDYHGSQSGQASRLDSTDSLAGVTMARVLLLVPASTYRATDFLVAAGRLGLDLVVGSDGALPLSSRLLARVDPGDLQASVDRLMARSGPVDAVVAADTR
jgi:hypothetical protein